MRAQLFPRLPTSLTLSALIAGCGGTEPLPGGPIRPRSGPAHQQEDARPELMLARLGDTRLPAFSRGLLADPSLGSSKVKPIDVTFERTPAPEPYGVLIEWTRKVTELDALRSMPLHYFERSPDGTLQLYIVRWDGQGLAKEAVLTRAPGVWKDIRDEHQVVSPQNHDKPMRFWSTGLGASVEVDGCAVRLVLDKPRFDCAIGPRTRISTYHPRRVREGEPVPQSLFCLERCIDPNAPVWSPYFERDFGSLAQPPAALGLSYRVAAGPVLYLEDRPLQQPDRDEWSVASGFLFPPTPENLEAMACDLDGDTIASESCPWQPIHRFYTWSTSTAPEAEPFGRGLD